MKQAFLEFWSRVIDPATAGQVWAKLDASYGEPGRAYHNWSHIAAMLSDLDAMRDDPAFATVLFDDVELAIFFHDVVYEAGRVDNEERSAAQFRDAAGSGLPLKSLDRVTDMILATARHLPSDYLSTQLLLDLDLAVLGGSPAEYAAYAAAVRAEFSAVPDHAWREGRTAVMRRFLDRPRLYQTASFFDRLETPARRNIRDEIAMLAAGG